MPDRPPKDWPVVRLGDVARIRVSPVDKKSRPRQPSVLLCNYMDVYQNRSLYRNGLYKRATASRSQIEQFSLRAGDVVITKDSETPDDIAVPAVIRSAPEDLVCGYHLAILTPDRQICHPVFLGDQLAQERLSRYFAQNATGSTRYGLRVESISQAPIYLPSLHEQRRIAEILDTVDEAIRSTKQVTKKLKAMRQGLLHGLLTRGIDENGELRDPERHPEQFKGSPLGRIPRAWHVSMLQDLSVRAGSYGSGAAAIPNDPRLPRYVRITDIRDDGTLDPESRMAITWKQANPYMLKPGDLLFARSGATVGKTYLYRRSDGPCAHAGYVIKFEIDPSLADPTFVFLWTQSTSYAAWVQRTLRQGAQPNINATEYGRHLLPVPPKAEQQRLAVAMEEVTGRVAAEIHTASKLRLLKKGLMDDLLSGRVRVSAPDEAV